MPPTDNPESVHRPGNTTAQDAAQQHLAIKPPLPSLSFSRRREESIDIKVPALIAECLIHGFSIAFADALGNELLTHYYLSEQRVQLNIDRVFDRLIADFTGEIWDELWDYYYAANAQHARQLSLLFDGPVRQIILILLNPELSRCVLDRIGPGLSRRPSMGTGGQAVQGVTLGLALQVITRYWHREYASRSPGGNPDDISRTIENHVLTGKAFKHLVARTRKILYTPNYIQIHLMESAAWDIVIKRRRPPPPDGYHVLQFRFECDLRQRIMEAGHVDIDSYQVITGTAAKSVQTSVSEYAGSRWPRCGNVIVRCLKEAVGNATETFQQSGMFAGMSFWDQNEPAAALSPGLRLLHLEIEEGIMRLNVSAWVIPLVEIMQQMAWLCAALSTSPTPESITECGVVVNDWDYMNESTFVHCSLVHRAAPENEGAAWLKQRKGVIVVPGFPIEEHLRSDAI